MTSTVETKNDFVIPIGQRIGEIMEEKGAAFSIRAFSQRIGVSKDTLARMISGDRYINPSNLEIIAKGLSLPIERIKQEDSRKDYFELCELLNHNSNPQKALKMALKLEKLSVGVSEKCDALNNLARAYFDLGELDKAHLLWLQAYDLAQKIYKKYSSRERLSDILRRLMISFTARKEYTRLAEILSEVESVFSNNPAKLGSIYYSKAMLAEQVGNYELVREHLNKSLEYLISTGVQNQIGRAKLNLGYFEYKQRNYEKSKCLLEEAIEDLGQDNIRYIATKEYIKALLKVNEKEKAVELIHANIPQIQENHNLLGKYLLLQSIALDEAAHVEQVVNDLCVDDKVRRLVCLFLMNYYHKNGDSSAVMKYYSKVEELSIKNSDILHEGDL